jgi:hypothetical protein
MAPQAIDPMIKISGIPPRRGLIARDSIRYITINIRSGILFNVQALYFIDLGHTNRKPVSEALLSHRKGSLSVVDIIGAMSPCQ